LPGSKVARPRLDQPFVNGSLDTAAGTAPVVPARLAWTDRVGGYRVRWGFGRYTYTVDPGLYAVGAPDDRSPVLLSANYKLSFDALRRELEGRSAWIVVVDTRGINVWCAAGKGTFGTDEVVRRIQSCGLSLVVSHNTIVLPQLSASGVAAPEVRRRTGFRAIYGPVRASDVPEFLERGMRATPEMRRVRYTIRDRLVLTPVEIANELKIAAGVAAGTVIAGGLGQGIFSLARMLDRAPLGLAAVAAAMIAGTFVTPLLLPWVPGRMFSAKGALVGLLAAMAVAAAFGAAAVSVTGAAAALFIIVGSSFAAMNFTGTSTFTSLHGVEKEMRLSMPLQAAGAALAAALWIAGGWL
jgi:acetyl-CoA decarbonylase/synthase complex subunit gamma